MTRRRSISLGTYVYVERRAIGAYRERIGESIRVEIRVSLFMGGSIFPASISQVYLEIVALGRIVERIYFSTVVSYLDANRLRVAKVRQLARPPIPRR